MQEEEEALRIVVVVCAALFALGKLLEYLGASTPMIIFALVATCVVAFLSMVRIVNSSRAAEAAKKSQGEPIGSDAAAESKKKS